MVNHWAAEDLQIHLDDRFLEAPQTPPKQNNPTRQRSKPLVTVTT
jgi:hypothetical protein